MLILSFCCSIIRHRISDTPLRTVAPLPILLTDVCLELQEISSVLQNVRACADPEACSQVVRRFGGHEFGLLSRVETSSTGVARSNATCDFCVVCEAHPTTRAASAYGWLGHCLETLIMNLKATFQPLYAHWSGTRELRGAAHPCHESIRILVQRSYRFVKCQLWRKWLESVAFAYTRRERTRLK